MKLKRNHMEMCKKRRRCLIYYTIVLMCCFVLLVPYEKRGIKLRAETLLCVLLSSTQLNTKHDSTQLNSMRRSLSYAHRIINDTANFTTNLLRFCFRQMLLRIEFYGSLSLSDSTPKMMKTRAGNTRRKQLDTGWDI